MENQEPNIEETNTKTETTSDFFRKGVEDAAEKAKEYAPKFKEEIDSILSEVAFNIS